MKYTLKLLTISLCFIFLVGCGSEESNGGSSDEVEFSCAPIQGSHQGCCSGHDGFDRNCQTGEAGYTSGGKLVCNDGTVSPTCTN